jgi:hypothetical protein
VVSRYHQLLQHLALDNGEVPTSHNTARQDQSELEGCCDARHGRYRGAMDTVQRQCGMRAQLQRKVREKTRERERERERESEGVRESGGEGEREREI